MSPTHDNALVDPEQLIADLRRQLAECKAERDEALEQQTATNEVLQVINSSPGDLGPVFDAMLEKAMRLCEAAFGILLTYDGDRFHFAALRSIPPAYAEFMREHPPIYGPGTSPGQLALGAPLVHVVDLTDTDSYRSGDPNRRAIADLAGARTLIAVPLHKDNALAGAIVVFRQEVRPFSEKQIALLQNFAAQAVIAMENARLLGETREALEQQTATAEVLQVINSSPGDLAPVFDAILEKAHRLCGAELGSLVTYDGERFRALATHGYPEEYAAVLRQPFPASTFHRALLNGEQLVDLADTTAIEWGPGNEAFRRAIETSGAGSALLVPLRKDNALLGLISAGRKEVRAFTEKEIALLQNFAAQAVIAMENARLLTETREALEQQTATSEILRVVSGSQADVQPVFDAIVESASRLCEAEFSAVARFEDGLLNLVATNNLSPEEAAAFHSLFPRPPERNFAMGRAFLDGQPAHFDDVLALSDYDARTRQVLQSASGYRTFMAVPISRAGAPIGVIGCARRQVKPFTDAQIELLKTFAAQAVIAIENARLFNETREALEQQTATAEVLQVINSSPGDLAPVFDAMLEKAIRLCGAVRGQLATYDGGGFRFVAVHAEPGFVWEQRALGVAPPSSGVTWSRIVAGEPVVHIADVKDTELYRSDHHGARRFVDHAGGRSLITVALRKDDVLLGACPSNETGAIYGVWEDIRRHIITRFGYIRCELLLIFEFIHNTWTGS